MNRVAFLAGATAIAVLLLCPDASSAERAAWRGVDLSYVNELEDCGAHYRDDAGREDPFAIFAAAGANIVRLRLWHTPEWTRYSTLDDVRKSIRRARGLGLRVLLDFHYSDDWAHPGKQLVPAAWRDLDEPELAAALGAYTERTLESLAADGLLPDVVQVGNETNTDLLITEEIDEKTPVRWSRNAPFLNAGIRAVRRVAEHHDHEIRVMLHVAQPENVVGWFEGAVAAGVEDFDIIGVSYYPRWSSTPFDAVGPFVAALRTQFGRDVVIVETAYPWTLDAEDDAHNLLGEDALVAGYPASIDGQRRWLVDLQRTVQDAGGLGTVYWEPAWISTRCKTRWGQGSHWENATLFDSKTGSLHAGAAFLASGG
ncbi:MAG: glycosyl hydrolase 53 family protein [Pseudomonadota bacterium]